MYPVGGKPGCLHHMQSHKLRSDNIGANDDVAGLSDLGWTVEWDLVN